MDANPLTTQGISLQAKYLLERDSHVTASKTLLNLSALASALCLLTALTQWKFAPHINSTPPPAFKIRLENTQKNTLPPKINTPLLPKPAAQQPNQESPPPIPSPEAAPTKKPSADKAAQPIELKASAQHEQTSSATKPWGNVFDNRLRAQLQQRQQGKGVKSTTPITTYRNLDDSQAVQVKQRCFTVSQSDISPTGLQWSLPHSCYGQTTESDRIANGLQQAMQARFPKEKSH